MGVTAKSAPFPAPLSAPAVPQVSSPPALEISPPSLDFGGQNYGTTSTPQALMLLNKGASPLTVSRIFLVQSSGSGNFAVVADNCSGVAVPAGGTCAASLTFTPNQTGVLSAPLAGSYNPSGSPPLTTTVPFTGVSIAGNPTAFPKHVKFSDTPIRSASP